MTKARWALGALIVGGCAGAASSDFGERISRLEARLGQLEKAPSDAGTQPDVSDPEFGVPIMANEAAAGEKISVHRLGYPAHAGAPDAAATLRACLADAEQRCRLVVVHERSPSGMTWKRRVAQAQAKDTPEGRHCLTTQRRPCQAVFQESEKFDARFAKLDAELKSASADTAFAAELSQLLKQDAGVREHDVACTKQFCRVRQTGELNLNSASRLLGNHVIIMTRGDATYVTRNGYQFQD